MVCSGRMLMAHTGSCLGVLDGDRAGAKPGVRSIDASDCFPESLLPPPPLRDAPCPADARHIRTPPGTTITPRDPYCAGPMSPH
jgi:hypothetical protein